MGSHSGLVRLLGEQLYPQGYREFESRPHRNAMNFLKKSSLLFVVFLTGGCVLIIEVVATRILSPYYGNTIFTVSSVIGVVLAALSIGYFIGGRLADKYPKEKVFYGIIFLSGISVLFLCLLNLLLLPILGYGLSIVSGPLIFSVILFFFPGFLLGMLSPFAIKLQEMRLPKKGIGSTTGEIFFWSTLGSIFGSLGAGFVLIPHFGINQIIFSVGIILTSLGLFPLIQLGLGKKSTLVAILFIITAGFLINYISSLHGNDIVYSHDGVYEKITIYDGKYNKKPTRFFQQDRSSSGAMFLDSNELVYDYTKYYNLYQVFKPDIRQALIIGGGAYSIPKTLLAELPKAHIDVAEIEPSLFELGKKYFKVKDDPRLKNYVEDGRRLLHDTDKKYDLIFSDVYYSLFSIPAHFTTQEFFKIAKDKLGKNGIFIANLVGDLSGAKPSLFLSEARTFKYVFPNSFFFAVDSRASFDLQNIIFVGQNSGKKIDLNNPKIKESKNEIIRNLAKKAIDINSFDLALYPKLTDNFSPVEYLTAKVLRKSVSEQIKLLDGKKMLALIAQQLSYGPRFLSSDGHKKTQEFLISQINTFSHNVKVQKWVHNSANGTKNELENIIGRFYPEKAKRIILASHYDSKRFADRDSKNPSFPVPGANDSASGVAVLLEIARFIANASEKPQVGIDIVFFDGEEGEEEIKSDYSKWVPLGSTYFAENLGALYPEEKPKVAVVLDMVCDKHLNISKERSSVNNARDQVQKFWNIAEKFDSRAFKSTVEAEIRDDHTPLNTVGIPSFLIIDFDYSPFHTRNDTIDKCSSDSLGTVGNATLKYLYAINKT